MSFVTIAPEMLTTAAGNLAGIGSTLGQATAAAAGPTTSVAAAAADDVSIAFSQLFGTYGQQFQALSAQAAAFHNQFVSSLNGGAAAYLSTEIANAQQGLGNAVTTPGAMGATVAGNAGAAATNPILGGLGSILNGTGGAVSASFSSSGSSLLSGLSAATATAAQAGGPWQNLFNTTGANLNTIFTTWAADPFPVLKQVIVNQNGYAQIFWSGVARQLQNFPATLANVPTNIQLAIQGASTFNPMALAQAYINQQIDYGQTIVTSLQNAAADFQKTFPVFEYDMGQAGNAITAGNYPGAEQDATQAILDLFISGWDTSNLSSTFTNTPPNIESGFPQSAGLQSQIAGPIGIEGPLGDLFPILAIPAQQAQNFMNLMPHGSVPWQMAHNYYAAVSTLTNTNISTKFSLIADATVSVAPILPNGGLAVVIDSSSAAGDAFFGLPLVLGVAAVGPPFATLGGLFTGGAVLGNAVATGNGVAAVGALIDMPAYVLNGFLNGTVPVDLPLTVAETLPLSGGSATITAPAVVHVPFNGILVPPQPVTATVPLGLSGNSVITSSLLPFPLPVDLNLYTTQYNLTLGGTAFGGAVDELLNVMPQQIALAISPNGPYSTQG
jgi:hypothetical protein